MSVAPPDIPYKNGQIPAHALRPITGGGYLLAEAAASFMAMNEESLRRFKVKLQPTYPQCAYRDLHWQQVYYSAYINHHGNLAAAPGTSNHGWGIAVDFPTAQMQQIVNEIGPKYGWSHAWSDAPTEPWHIPYKMGTYKGRIRPASRPGAGRKAASGKTGGSASAQVAVGQQLLRAHGFTAVPVDGKLGPRTVHALKHFQGSHGLPRTGKPDRRTIAALTHTTSRGGAPAKPGAPSRGGAPAAGVEQAWVKTSAISRAPDPPGWTRAWVLADAGASQASRAPHAAPRTHTADVTSHRRGAA